jgi:hypothetical protein
MLPNAASLDAYRLPMDKMVEAARLLQRQGVVVHKVSDLSISASCSKREFEALFGTRLVEKEMPRRQAGHRRNRHLPRARYARIPAYRGRPARPDRHSGSSVTCCGSSPSMNRFIGHLASF